MHGVLTVVVTREKQSHGGEKAAGVFSSRRIEEEREEENEEADEIRYRYYRLVSHVDPDRDICSLLL